LEWLINARATHEMARPSWSSSWRPTVRLETNRRPPAMSGRWRPVVGGWFPFI
jgi:hypothetical protein